ncbi:MULTISPECIES: glycosyltransferase [Acinetobacter]|uniref:Glycosyltransferase n=1 Tax=Acinetobacter piscicola TaxID=2006115 RepID=A0A7S7AFN6_9GAMM|nr:MULTISPECIES: glycosyltransferase [Acinetobacter]QOW44510.1 glycosyltransferase [Acinetobacter piscicola]
MSLNNQPLVSVVIPCYNHENFVQDCIQSVIDQTYENIELIVIDDGSKDSSVEKIQQMIESCEKRFVRFEFRYRLNKGLTATLNEALEWCRGEYYSAIASDDMMCIKKTESQVSYLKAHKNCAAVFGGVELIDESNNIIGKRLNETKVFSFKEIILNQHDLPASTQLARLKIIKEIGGYNTNIKIEDWYMLLKMTVKEQFEVHYLDQLMCMYRFHNENFSKNMKLMSIEMISILQDYRDSKLYKKALIKVYRMEFSYYKKNKEFLNALVILVKLVKLKFFGN